jgi:hypothetical protein
MKRVLVVFSLFALVFLPLIGQPAGAQGTIYAPSNTPSAGSCNAFPWGYSTSARFQEIIPAQYLPSAPFKITDIGFASCGNANFTAKRLRVRVCHTTLTSFAGNTNFNNNLCPCPTTMYDGPMNWAMTANQWSSLGMNCSFGYDGVRNVLFEFCIVGRSGGSSCHRDSVLPRLWAFGSSNPCTVPTGSTDGGSTQAGLKMCLTIDRTCVLNAPDTASIGTSVPIQVTALPVGNFYQIAASLSDNATINLGQCKICLVPDSLFLLSVLLGPPIFNGYSGTVGPAGRVAGKLAVPNNRQLVGVCVYHAAIAYSTAGVTCCTNTAGTGIVP